MSNTTVLDKDAEVFFMISQGYNDIGVFIETKKREISTMRATIR